MKYIFAALAICASSQIPKLIPTEAPQTTSTSDTVDSKEPVVNKPNFSVIEIPHARNFIERIYPYADSIEQQYKLPAEVTIAIACLESGYGRSHYAKTKHNFLGIRAYQRGKAGYRTFKSDAECFEYFERLLFENERYDKLKEIQGDDLREWIQTLCDLGYNHRQKYVEKLLHLIDFLKLQDLQIETIA